MSCTDFCLKAFADIYDQPPDPNLTEYMNGCKHAGSVLTPSSTICDQDPDEVYQAYELGFYTNKVCTLLKQNYDGCCPELDTTPSEQDGCNYMAHYDANLLVSDVLQKVQTYNNFVDKTEYALGVMQAKAQGPCGKCTKIPSTS